VSLPKMEISASLGACNCPENRGNLLVSGASGAACAGWARRAVAGASANEIRLARPWSSQAASPSAHPPTIAPEPSARS